MVYTGDKISFRVELMMFWLQPWLYWVAAQERLYARIMHWVGRLRHGTVWRSWYIRTSQQFAVDNTLVVGNLRFRIKSVQQRHNRYVLLFTVRAAGTFSEFNLNNVPKARMV